MKHSDKLKAKINFEFYPMNEEETHILFDGDWLEILEDQEGDFYIHPNGGKPIYFEVREVTDPKTPQQIASEWWEGLDKDKRGDLMATYLPKALFKGVSEFDILCIYNTETGREETEAGNTKTEREQALEWWDKLKDNQVRIDLKNTHYPNKSLLDVFKNSKYILHIWQQETQSTPSTQQRKEREGIKHIKTDPEWHKGYIALGADRMAWKKEAEELKAENKRLSRLLEDLTPGGSEFVDSPQTCFDYVKSFQDDAKKSILFFKKEAERLQDIKRELLDGISEGIATLMSFEESNSWESRDGETLNKLSELLSKYTA